MAKLTINDREIEIVTLDQWTWAERRLAKQLTREMTEAEMLIGWRQNDPDVWLAVAVISARRVDPTIRVEDFDEVNFYDVTQSVKTDASDAPEGEKAEDDAGPPARSGPEAPEPSTEPSSPSSESAPAT